MGAAAPHSGLRNCFDSYQRALEPPGRARFACPGGGRQRMATTSRKDFDADLATWLAGVQAEQSVEELDQLADLFLANADAHAIPDKGSPAAGQAHARINVILDRIVGL